MILTRKEAEDRLKQEADAAFATRGQEGGVQFLLDNAEVLFNRTEDYAELNRRKDLELAREIMDSFPPAQQCMTYQQARQRKPRSNKDADPAQHAISYARNFRKCPHCGSFKHHQDASGHVTCLDCATCSFEPFNHGDLEPGAMPYADLQGAISSSGANKRRTGYKRTNYLDALLNRLLGRNGDPCPPDLAQQVGTHLHQRRARATLGEIRRSIRSLGLKGCYKYSGAIQKALDPKHHLGADLNEADMDFLRDRFARIQKHFDKIRGLRKNFFNYRYVIKQLLRLRGKERLAAQIPSLNNKQRMRRHDSFWKQICQALGWPFLPTV